MRRPFMRLAAAGLLAAATFTGTALAGGNPNAPGQQRQTPPGQVAKASSAPEPPGQAKKTSATVQAGVKPGPTTAKWTHCTTGGAGGGIAACAAQPGTPSTSADVSKRYGNGKTAAQIAVSRGAPDGTLLTGPGNSQPHKVTACGKPSNKSGGVDVHAVKAYVTAGCAQATPAIKAQAAVAPAVVTVPPTLPATPTPAVAPAPSHNVLGAHVTLRSPKPAPGHGVLGTVARLGSTLPFTGLRLWLIALVALTLTGAGVLVRRSA